MADEMEQAIDERKATAAQLRPGDPGHTGYPLEEAQYWREAYASEPYYLPGRSFEDYGTAYELGWVSYHLYDEEFEIAERVLANDWMVRKGVSTLSWDEARPAARAAWQRAHSASAFATNGTASAEAVREMMKDLFASARDGELGLREAATHARAPELVALFERLAQQCGAAAAQWRERIAQSGDSVDDGGTVAGAAQRVWLQIRGLFGGASDQTLLQECERGLDDLAAHDRAALGGNLPPDLHAIVQLEYEQVLRHRDHIRTLRERAAAAVAELAA